MAEPLRPHDPDCCPFLSRREFVKTVGSAALAAAAPMAGASPASGRPAGPSPTAPAETAVARFYRTLRPDQKKQICFAFNHPLRLQVRNNWAIVQPTIGDMSKEQQALCREVFKNLCSEEGYERFTRQMGDDYGGFESYHVAVFGEPGTDKPFEWVLTGRHDTLRADGNSVAGAAFGGPIFYGHAAEGRFNEDPRHTHNVWWYQGEQANAVFATLDGKQRAKALVGTKEDDDARTIRLKGAKLAETGLPVSDLDGQQKKMVQTLLDAMMRPFRVFDAEEVRECLDEAGGLDKLRLTYFKEGDIGDDGVWDVWKLEGPAFSWYFHGSPHVHTWLNVARRA
jgi:hypothetical protein